VHQARRAALRSAAWLIPERRVLLGSRCGSEMEHI